jgi:hypothetical protein
VTLFLSPFSHFFFKKGVFIIRAFCSYNIRSFFLFIHFCIFFREIFYKAYCQIVKFKLNNNNDNYDVTRINIYIVNRRLKNLICKQINK